MDNSHYKGDPDRNAQPLAFVGKGITFDSGGISLKPADVSEFITVSILLILINNLIRR